MKRREFVGVTALAALQFYVQGCGLGARAATRPSAVAKTTKNTSGSQLGFGPLIERPGQLLDLPEGFEYVVLQKGGDALSDGFRMPFQPDGMACFLDASGQYVLLRNHELGDTDFLTKRGYQHGFGSDNLVPSPSYSSDHYGGVVRVVVDPKQLAADLRGGVATTSTAVTSSNFVLAGTSVNCAGGQFPEGWITCEETTASGHGYAFLTKPTDSTLVKPRRIDSWGRLYREAVVLDPRTGIVYMTEDRADGCFYRHVPDDPANPYGPGTVQALRIKGVPDSSPYPKPTPGKPAHRKWQNDQRWSVDWVKVPDRHAEKESCRAQAASLGATTFMRGEGITWDGQSVWFTASLGGVAAAGQIFQYEDAGGSPNTGTLTLRYEVTDRTILSCPDNLVMTPWNELLLAEDNYRTGAGCTHQYIRCMNRNGQIYDIARNRNNFPKAGKAGAEFTGACFSPDGRYLFVNVQNPENVTVAIRGPWTVPKAT